MNCNWICLSCRHRWDATYTRFAKEIHMSKCPECDQIGNIGLYEVYRDQDNGK